MDPNDAQALLNYRNAFELVAQYISDGEPITEGLIREIHKRLVKDVRGNATTPGLYRKVPNYVVNSKTKKVIYTPPPVYELSQMMQELVDWINYEKLIHPILIASIAQFQLVHIQPFLDGNGRTARLLSTLCLYRSGYDFKKLFTKSEYYDRNHSDYYLAIQNVRENDMDMTQWLEYFTIGLATQLQEVKELGTQAIKQNQLIKQHNLSDRQKVAIEHISKHGGLSIQEFEKIYPEVTRRTLQRELRQLADKGIVKTTGATSNLVYQLNN